MNISKIPKKLNPNMVVSAPLVVSAVRYENPVGKPYGLKDGVVTKGKSIRTPNAVGETLPFNSFDVFAEWRSSLPTEVMLVSGTFAGLEPVPVVFKGKEADGEVSASKDYLAHRERPGILIIDIDFKNEDEVAGFYPTDVKPYASHEEALRDLSKILPEADDCALLIGWSTSSNLFDEDGNQVKGTGGIRIYLPVTDASKIPVILIAIHKRCWRLGLGWGFVGVGGRFHERSIVDLALGRVTQPDYAAPDLSDGLTQDREWKDYEGVYLDPNNVPGLTVEEEAEYKSAVETAKEALAPAMKVERERWLEDRVEKAVAKGETPKRAKATAIQSLDNGVLLPSDTVIFEDGIEVTVLELLTNGAAYDGKTCLDVIEPDYNDGAVVGIFYWNEGEGPCIHSFAHGSKWYSLKHDAQSAKEALVSGDDNVISLALARIAKKRLKITTSGKQTLNQGLCRSLKVNKLIFIGETIRVFAGGIGRGPCANMIRERF